MQRPDSGKGWIPALVVALGLGTAAGTAIPRQTLVPESSQAAESDSSEAPSVQEASSQGVEPPTFLAHLRPVMGLLEEALGVDPEPTEEIRAAATLHQYLCALRALSPADRKARDATAILWRELEKDGYAAHAARSRHVHERDPKWAAEVLSGYSSEKLPKDGHIDLARRRLVEHFQRRDADAQRLDRLLRINADVQFVIATIADYVDSSSGWNADQQIDAIQSGMAKLQYVLDRFYLPDWNHGGAPRAKKQGRRHEREPGAILFRRPEESGTSRSRAKASAESPATSAAQGRVKSFEPGESWMLVLLVTETPTYGINKEAFINAGRFIGTWQTEQEKRRSQNMPDQRKQEKLAFDTKSSQPTNRTLRVLGPTYSGSIWSMRRALHELATRYEFQDQSARIDVVSGSANLDSNKKNLESVEKVSFTTTLASSGELAQALRDYLRRLNTGWGSGKGVAVLHESNTWFGSDSVKLENKTSQPVDEESSDSEAALTLADQFPKATFIPFPLHISRLRQAPTSGPALQNVNWTLPRGLVPLNVKDAVTATDYLPAFNADITASSVQAVVSGILHTLRRESFGAVGILATDDRDVLYLARELRRAVPNVQLFFMGSHVLFLHPEFVPYTKGSLVASTYPLFMGAQRWMPRRRGDSDSRHQFYSTVNEGISNALVMLLHEPDVEALCRTTPPASQTSLNAAADANAGTASEIVQSVPRLHDYYPVRVREGEQLLGNDLSKGLCAKPPIWISVVGRDAFWPLRQISDSAQTLMPSEKPSYPGLKSLVHLARSIAGGSEAPGIEVVARRTPPHPLAVTGLVGFALFVLWHVLTIGRQVVGSGKVLGRMFANRASEQWVNACHAARIGGIEANRFLRSRPDPAFARHRAGEQRARRLGVILDRDSEVTKAWDNFEKQERGRRIQDYQRVFTLPTTASASRGTAHALIFAAFGVLGLLALCIANLVWVAHFDVPPMEMWNITALALFVSIPCLLFVRYPSQPSCDKRSSQSELVEVGALIVVIGCLAYLGVSALTPDPLRPSSGLFQYERSVALTSFVSPIVPLVLLLMAIYMWIRWQLDRISQQSEGYTHLFGPTPTTMPTMCGLLLWGTLSIPDLGSRFRLLRKRFIELVDSPLAVLLRYFGLATSIAAACLIGIVLFLVLSRVHTVEGLTFTNFFRMATGLTMTLMLIALFQTIVLWGELRPVLARLDHSGFRSAFTKVSKLGLDWRLNLRLPRKDELRRLMKLIDQLNREISVVRDGAFPGLSTRYIARQELDTQSPTTASSDPIVASLVAALDDECVRAAAEDEHGTAVTRIKALAKSFLGRDQEPGKVALLMSPTFRLAWRDLQIHLVAVQQWQAFQAQLARSKASNGQEPRQDAVEPFDPVSRWFKNAETAIALALAFVIRDLLSRVVSGLSVATVGFFLILLSHLLYSFQGRSMLLTLDWVAVAVTSSIALFVVVQMERNEVLSRLWNSTPGRVTFNRDFVGRVAIYGALPLVTIVSGVFPEIGDTLFSWLAPVRQLVSF